MFTHQVFAVDEDEHQDDDDRLQDSVEDLGENGHADQLAIWKGQDGDGSACNQQSIVKLGPIVSGHRIDSQ